MARILLVENNEMNRDMLSCRVARSGYDVLLEAEGEQGIAMAKSGSPDLVLMDMSSVLDRSEATRRLKSDPATGRIPVIALIAHAMSGDRDRAREAGCDDFDIKPVEFARLRSKIEVLLQSGKAG